MPQLSGVNPLPQPRALPPPTEAETRQRPSTLPEPLPPPAPNVGRGSYAPPPPSYAPASAYAPAGFGPPPPAPSYAPATASYTQASEPPQRASTTTRLTASDDVQVLDRNEMPAQALTEEDLIAEADRLAIEAVRRSEEARAASLRAERRGAMARMAAEAALIAADAVRLLGTSGLAAAAHRLEQARTVERTIPRAQRDAGSATAPIPESVVASALRSSPPANGYPAQSTNRPSYLPPVYDGAALGSTPRPSHASLPLPPPSPILLPAPVSYSNLPPDPGPHPLAFDDRAFRARLKPGILGMPPLAIAGLGIVAFCVVFLLIWLFFG